MYFLALFLFISTLQSCQARFLPNTKWSFNQTYNSHHQSAAISTEEKELPLKIKMSSKFYSDIAKFCKHNGLNYLTIANLPHFVNMDTKLAIIAILQHNIMFTYLSFDDIPKNYLHHQDNLLLFTKSDILLQNGQSFEKYLSLISKLSKIKRCLIVFTTPLTIENEKLLHKRINLIEENSLFYIAFQNFDNLVSVKSKMLVLEKS